MLITLSAISMQSGENVPGYIDASEIVSWIVWDVPLDYSAPGAHRSIRGKKLITIHLCDGMMHWTDESFHSISKRILEARGQTDEAKAHAEMDKTLSGTRNKSPLAV